MLQIATLFIELEVKNSSKSIKLALSMVPPLLDIPIILGKINMSLKQKDTTTGSFYESWCHSV